MRWLRAWRGSTTDRPSPTGHKLAAVNGHPKTALVTGISGQDGSFLAELLLAEGYRVTGLVRSSDGGALGFSEHLRGRLELLSGELLEPASLTEAVRETMPGEIYHLAAPSFVPASWQQPSETMRAITGSCATLLEAVRDLCPSSRVFMAASGAIFGAAPESPQSELTPCRPANPYAIAKLAAHQLLGAMREHDELHASSGIVFNHESERRPEQFVPRRISRGAAAIALGIESELTLGSLEAVRDWSFAGDVMRGAWLMLQQDRPDDYVLASGVGRTVGELARTAFACLDLDAERYVRVDPTLVREEPGTPSVGDPAKARRVLGWQQSLSFQELVERMVRHDLRELEGQAKAG